jgi:hypothetical protein
VLVCVCVPGAWSEVDSPPEISFWERGEGMGGVRSSDSSLCERGEGRGAVDPPEQKNSEKSAP